MPANLSHASNSSAVDTKDATLPPHSRSGDPTPDAASREALNASEDFVIEPEREEAVADDSSSLTSEEDDDGVISQTSSEAAADDEEDENRGTRSYVDPSVDASSIAASLPMRATAAAAATPPVGVSVDTSAAFPENVSQLLGAAHATPIRHTGGPGGPGRAAHIANGHVAHPSESSQNNNAAVPPSSDGHSPPPKRAYNYRNTGALGAGSSWGYPSRIRQQSHSRGSESPNRTAVAAAEAPQRQVAVERSDNEFYGRPAATPPTASIPAQTRAAPYTSAATAPVWTHSPQPSSQGTPASQSLGVSSGLGSNANRFGTMSSHPGYAVQEPLQPHGPGAAAARPPTQQAPSAQQAVVGSKALELAPYRAAPLPPVVVEEAHSDNDGDEEAEEYSEDDYSDEYSEETAEEDDYEEDYSDEYSEETVEEDVEYYEELYEEEVEESEESEEEPRIDIIEGNSHGRTMNDILYGTPKAGYNHKEAQKRQAEQRGRSYDTAEVTASERTGSHTPRSRSATPERKAGHAAGQKRPRDAPHGKKGAAARIPREPYTEGTYKQDLDAVGADLDSTETRSSSATDSRRRGRRDHEPVTSAAKALTADIYSSDEEHSSSESDSATSSDRPRRERRGERDRDARHAKSAKKAGSSMASDEEVDTPVKAATAKPSQRQRATAPLSEGDESITAHTEDRHQKGSKNTGKKKASRARPATTVSEEEPVAKRKKSKHAGSEGSAVAGDAEAADHTLKNGSVGSRKKPHDVKATASDEESSKSVSERHSPMAADEKEGEGSAATPSKVTEGKVKSKKQKTEEATAEAEHTEDGDKKKHKGFLSALHLGKAKEDKASEKKSVKKNDAHSDVSGAEKASAKDAKKADDKSGAAAKKKANKDEAAEEEGPVAAKARKAEEKKNKEKEKDKKKSGGFASLFSCCGLGKKKDDSVATKDPKAPTAKTANEKDKKRTADAPHSAKAASDASAVAAPAAAKEKEETTQKAASKSASPTAASESVREGSEELDTPAVNPKTPTAVTDDRTSRHSSSSSSDEPALAPQEARHVAHADPNITHSPAFTAQSTHSSVLVDESLVKPTERVVAAAESVKKTKAEGSSPAAKSSKRTSRIGTPAKASPAKPKSELSIVKDSQEMREIDQLSSSDEGSSTLPSTPPPQQEKVAEEPSRRHRRRSTRQPRDDFVDAQERESRRTPRRHRSSHAASSSRGHQRRHRRHSGAGDAPREHHRDQNAQSLEVRRSSRRRSATRDAWDDVD